MKHFGQFWPLTYLQSYSYVLKHLQFFQIFDDLPNYLCERILWTIPLDSLARLYLAESPSIARKLIVNSEPEHLCLLIQILHYISNGSIPLKSKNFYNVCKAKKHGFIFKSFRSVENANKLLNESRENQCKPLTRIASCYKDLFHVLFHEH